MLHKSFVLHKAMLVVTPLHLPLCICVPFKKETVSSVLLSGKCFGRNLWTYMGNWWISLTFSGRYLPPEHLHLFENYVSGQARCSVSRWDGLPDPRLPGHRAFQNHGSHTPSYDTGYQQISRLGWESWKAIWLCKDVLHLGSGRGFPHRNSKECHGEKAHQRAQNVCCTTLALLEKFAHKSQVH